MTDDTSLGISGQGSDQATQTTDSADRVVSEPNGRHAARDESEHPEDSGPGERPVRTGEARHSRNEPMPNGSETTESIADGVSTGSAKDAGSPPLVPGSVGATETTETIAEHTGRAEGAGKDAQERSESGEGQASPARWRWWPRGRTSGKPGSFWRELPILLVIAFVLAVLIKSFLVQAFFIPSGSMEKTLHGCPGCSGDRVLVNRLSYRFGDPQPGDIVVFKGEGSWADEIPQNGPSNPIAKAFHWLGVESGLISESTDFVKRVIAVGGQTVKCCDDQGRVTVDGTPLKEAGYVYDPTGQGSQPFGPITVPRGRLWVMGDHRDDSADSRFHMQDHLGTISEKDVIGRAFAIIWPIDRWRGLGIPSAFDSIRGSDSAHSDVVIPPGAVGLLGVTPLAAWRERRRRRHRRGNSRHSGS